MERRLPVILISCVLSVIIQIPAVADIGQNELIRFALWAPLEAYPGTEEAAHILTPDGNPFLYPISRLKAVAPFFVEGMVCGWTFSYTPSDTTRNVAEYFEVKPLYNLNDLGQPVTYTEPWIQDERLYCWVEYRCSSRTSAWRNLWHSPEYQKISGKGQGLLIDGFDGIKTAATEALKQAVREYVRKLVKNKPQEITGEVVICREPRIGIVSGRYVVDLDFFLNVSRIRDYSAY